MLKSGKSINVLSHVMQLLAVVTLFTEAVICLVSAHYEPCCFSCQPLFNLFSSFPLLGGYTNRLYSIEDQAMRLKLMIHIVKERCFLFLFVNVVLLTCG